jgi:hypothetical protein
MDAEISTHTFLAMIIEESVCFMSCEPFFWCNYSYVVHTEYIFACIRHCFHQLNSSHERYSPQKSSNLGSRAYHLHYCTGKQNYLLSNILQFALKICFWTIFNVMQLILVKIKWKYLIQKSHDICLSYYFNLEYPFN